MNTIESKIAELNTLCTQFINEIGNQEIQSRIRELFSDLGQCGYHVVTPTFESNSIEYEILSDKCKEQIHHLYETRRKKMEVINNQEFEKAADLRDLERNLFQQVIIDFLEVTDYKFFVLLSKDSKEIIFNDPKGQLMEMFKKS